MEQFTIALMMLVPLYEGLTRTRYYLAHVENWKRTYRAYIRFVQLALAASVWTVFSFTTGEDHTTLLYVEGTILLCFALAELLEGKGWKKILLPLISRGRPEASAVDLQKRAVRRKAIAIFSIVAILIMQRYITS